MTTEKIRRTNESCKMIKNKYLTVSVCVSQNHINVCAPSQINGKTIPAIIVTILNVLNSC